MSLDDWVNNGWLRRHTPTSQEITDLFAVADRDLSDCATSGLSDDWRFGIAYNAALQMAHAALAAAGYETPKGDSHHFRVIQSLEHTIAADTALIRTLDAFRKKRNAGVYERVGAISRRDADDLTALATDLLDRVRAWVQSNHGDLLP